MSIFSDSWNWFSAEANDLATKKGWWETDRSFLECMGLVVSELGEAAEAFRKPRCSAKILAHSHAAEELADVVIRLADMVRQFKMDVAGAPWFERMSSIFDECWRATPEDKFSACIRAIMSIDLPDRPYNPIEYIALVSGELGEAIVDYQMEDDPCGATDAIACAFLTLCQLAQANRIDLGEAILAKHAYNQARSYRHGDKRY